MFATRTNWPLEPNRLALALEKHRQSGKEILDLTASNPTDCGLNYPEQEILAALADPRDLVYRPESKGLCEARAAIAAYYSGRKGFSESASSVDPERALLASGTSEAYSHVFRLLCDPDDQILVPEPSYPLLGFLADLSGVHLVPYCLLYDHGWQIDLASVRAALTPRSRALVVVHPNNPTGSFVKPREAAELAEICRAQDMAIVADEVFLDYADESEPPTSQTGRPKEKPRTFALHNAALTFTLSGISKISLLPQMKLAWTVVSGPESFVQPAIERLEIIADTYLSPSTPAQLALPTFLSLRQAMQSQLQRRISTNLRTLDSALRQSKSLSRLDREGGWYTALRVPVTGTDEDLAVALLERASIYVHPGHFFNFPGEGFLVLSLIAQEPEFQEGIRRLADFFAR